MAFINIIRIYLPILTLCFASCQNSSKPNDKDRSGFNAVYDKVINCREISGANKEIEKSLLTKEINKAESKYLEALALYNHGLHYDSVMSICETALSDRAVATDKGLSYRLYYLLSNVAYTSSNYPDMIKYSSLASRTALELGKDEKAQEMYAAVGYGNVLMGHGNTGLKMIDNALNQLSTMNTWESYNGQIITYKYKISCLDKLGETGMISDAAKHIISIVDILREKGLHTDGIPQCFTKDSIVYQETLDTYRMQALAYLAYSYAKTKNTSKAKAYIKEFERNPMSKTVDGKRIIVSALAELGMFDKMLEAYSDIDKSRCRDTINESFYAELQYKSRAAAAKDNDVMARLYLERALVIGDSLAIRSNRTQMARNMSIYRVQEERLKASKAESHAKTMAIASALVLAIALLLAILSILQYKKKKIISMKNMKLARNIEELYEYKNKYEDLLRGITSNKRNDNKNQQTDDNNIDKQLFLTIDEVIREEKLYLATDFQRQTLVDRLHTDRNRIGHAICEYSGFSNLSAYINNYRLEHAFKLLHSSDSNLTIDMIAKSSGFATARTFYRLFKEKYGMTPSEFRKNINEF